MEMPNQFVRSCTHSDIDDMLTRPKKQYRDNKIHNILKLVYHLKNCRLWWVHV